MDDFTDQHRATQWPRFALDVRVIMESPFTIECGSGRWPAESFVQHRSSADSTVGTSHGARPQKEEDPSDQGVARCAPVKHISKDL